MEHMERTHSLLSPSGAHRWLVCTPSARLEAEYPDESSLYSEEGTLAHQYAAWLLNGQKEKEKPLDIISPQMDGYVRDYVELIHEIAGDKKPIIETRVDLSNYVPEASGIVDAAVMTDDTLFIFDLKYGEGVLVEAKDNPQIMLYALGLIDKYEGFPRNVSMTIYQPRRDNCSNHVMETADLLEWAEAVLKPAAQKAFSGEGVYVPGEHCQFCKARNDCRARAGDSLELSQRELATIPQAEIDALVPKIPDMIAWLQDVFAKAQDDAIFNGKQFPGMELVWSRQNRKYNDSGIVAQRLIDAGRPDLVEMKPKGITETEKALGKKEFAAMLGDVVGYTESHQLLKPIKPETEKKIKNKT